MNGIELKNIYKNFYEVEALKGISINFKYETINGLIGYNGSGKTTIFNIISNLIEEYKGKVLFDGEKANDETYRKIAYLGTTSEPTNNDKTISYLLFVSGIMNYSKKNALVKINKLAKLLDFTQFLKTPIKALSKGNQQKIKLIITFLNEKSKYLLLDEPFDGIDPVMAKTIEKLILKYKKGRTIIITSHRLDIIDAICDQYFLIKDGVIVKERTRNDAKKVISVHVNKETDLKKIIDLPYVVNLITYSRENIIQIKSLKNYKKLNKILLDREGFVYCKIEGGKLSDDVFDEYGK